MGKVPESGCFFGLVLPVFCLGSLGIAGLANSLSVLRDGLYGPLSFVKTKTIDYRYETARLYPALSGEVIMPLALMVSARVDSYTPSRLL